MSSAATSAVKSSAASSERALASRPPRPTLRVLEGPVQRVRRIPFLVSCMALLCLGLLALLGLNIGLARGSYEVTMLQKQQQQLLENTQNLNEQLDTISSPAMLSSRARALGMVPSGAPVFIQLSDGRILGDPKRSVTQERPPSVDLTKPYASPTTSGASASSSSSTGSGGNVAYPTYGKPGPAKTSSPSSSSTASGTSTPSSGASSSGSTPTATSGGSTSAPSATPDAPGSTSPAPAGGTTPGN